MEEANKSISKATFFHIFISTMEGRNVMVLAEKL